MKYGFVIDNRKCIGCHACTVACKSEHDVPVGVNRTWVKQVEKGEFPNSRRVFSVLRCNHCTDAPCVEICPVEALYTREDGIVDFNNDRCIGCKSCMQACPYDALYIDPETHTAAKCNYCAHRVEIGLEPACVNVCPEHAIISGDMDNPETEIAQLLSREQTTVRKPEKGTDPNVFYIDGDRASLNPTETERSDQYIWSSQDKGVGHFARFMEDVSSAKDKEEMVKALNTSHISYAGSDNKTTSVEALMASKGASRVYDTPDKGILWGWEVSAYVLTKAIASGAILLPALAYLFGIGGMTQQLLNFGGIASLVFLVLTGALLVKDLDKPARFLYVLLRPQWKSWLTRGGYAITLMGAFVTLWIASMYLELSGLPFISFWVTAILSVIVAIYTAFLFAQAKGRDFWQSPLLVLHMVVHSIMSGASLFFIASLFIASGNTWISFVQNTLLISIIVNMLLMATELTITHPTRDAREVVKMILKGRYRIIFWLGVIVLGNIIPLVMLFIPGLTVYAALIVLIGIFITEKIWVEAPQRIPLT